MIDITLAFALVAGIIFFGFGAEIFFRKTGIPYFLFLIFIGVIIGPVLGLVSRSAFLPLLGVFSAFTLAMVLFYNGMQMGIGDVISSSSRTLLQVVLYVFVSIIAIAAVAHVLFGWDIISALIFGSIIGGETTAPVMMRVSKTLNQDNKTVTFLGLESVMNSIFSVIFFSIFLSIYLTGSSSLASAAGMLAASISVGVVFGLGLSMVWLFVLNYLRDYRYTYVFTLALLLTTYVVTQASGGSGLMAVLVFGIMLGNSKSVGAWLKRELKIEQLETQLRSFQDELAFLLETFFFVFLGLTFLVQPSAIVDNLLAGALFVAVLLVVRYFAVHVSTRGSELYKNRRLIILMCAQGLTPAILSIVALSDNLPLANQFVSIVVFVILITNTITAIGAYYAMKSGKASAARQGKAAEQLAAKGETKKQSRGSAVTA